jgi:hypothetical protein
MGNKYLRVEMPDGSLWDVPVMVIAWDRAMYYAENDADTDSDVERSLHEDTLPLFRDEEYEIHDWAANNMDWNDVKEHAVKARKPGKPNYQEGWVNGEWSVVTKEQP